jgi:hypothetical protein
MKKIKYLILKGNMHGWGWWDTPENPSLGGQGYIMKPYLKIKKKKERKWK